MGYPVLLGVRRCSHATHLRDVGSVRSRRRGRLEEWQIVAHSPRLCGLPLLVGSLLVSGTIFLAFVGNWRVLDAFYFSATTLTTVGLGDPDSPQRPTSSMSSM